MLILIELLKFIVYSLLLVGISKYVLVKVLRKLAESLNLKPHTVGNIAGMATSMPEFLSVTFASMSGLISTSVYNIFSSNLINYIQYIFSIFLNKNQKILNNIALRIDLIMSFITILIPIAMIALNIPVNLGLVPAFLLLFILFYFINVNSHKVYLEQEEQEKNKVIENERKFIIGKRKAIVKYATYLIFTGIILFIIGNLLSGVLESLCLEFNIPEIVIGIALGIITSLPELITFFESQKHYKSNEDVKLGVVEATNNLLTSNILNLFIIQSFGIIIYLIFN